MPNTNPFNHAFDRAFGSGPIFFKPPPSKTSDGPMGTTPYADKAEHVEEQTYPSAPRVYTKMAPTDARAIEIFLYPPHQNFIPNPACRADPTGQWTGTFTVVNDSWLPTPTPYGHSPTTRGKVASAPKSPIQSPKGLSLSSGTIRQRVYVGPSDNEKSAPDDWYEPSRSGSEYAFSLYAKGSADIQLSMYGYLPDEDGNAKSDHAAEVHSPFYPTESNWSRHSVMTTARLDDISGGIPEFAGCWWIDVEVETNGPVILSAFMLDPSEGPLCEYFDGSLDDTYHERDDFIWLGDPDDSISAYYPERLQRIHWLWKHIYMVTPVNRPVQMYFHDRSNPWEPDSPAVRSAVAPSINHIDRRLAQTI